MQALSLDAAGTLIVPREPVGSTYARIAADFGIEIEAANLGGGFKRAFPEMGPLAFEFLDREDLERQERDWWRRLVARVFGPERAAHPQFEAFFNHLYAHYATAEAWRVFDDVWPLLETAREFDIAVWVVSNFDTRLHEVLDGGGVSSLVDGVLCSSEAGAAKPSIKIFQQALQELGTPAEETLHIGDDREADYDGARDAGLQALWLRRESRQPARPTASTTIAKDTISDLAWVAARLRSGDDAR